ncbi:MAG: peptidase M15A [Cytophagales bacterium]|nr:peptidase M15A [Cytophagales bacterium]
MRLSKNFTLEEMIYSDTASRYGYHNYPTTTAIKNLGYLTQNFLQPLRDKLGKAILILSGYRSELVNQKVGGSSTSQHKYGQAVDIQVTGMSPLQLFFYIKESGLDYDQLILERTKKAEWVHVSYTKHNRHQALRYINGVYTLD